MMGPANYETLTLAEQAKALVHPRPPRLFADLRAGAMAGRCEHCKSPHPPCVEIEWLPLFIRIEELLKVPVCIEHTPSKQWVCWPSCQLLYSMHQILGES